MRTPSFLQPQSPAATPTMIPACQANAFNENFSFGPSSDPSLKASLAAMERPSPFRSTSSDSCYSVAVSDAGSSVSTSSSVSSIESPLSSPKYKSSFFSTDASTTSSASERSVLRPAEWEFSGQTPETKSSYLRSYSKFAGTQRSKDLSYNVEVEFKYVDTADSYCCGYLKIEGLTKDIPTMQTYFEGEIIGTKYGFQTDHDGWGASEKEDIELWSRFPGFAPFKQAAKKHAHYDPAFASRDLVFMRWKEQFLVDDHRERDLVGASFEGFYYIVLDQRTGAISGLYYHAKSGINRCQELELAPARQTFSAPSIEFR